MVVPPQSNCVDVLFFGLTEDELFNMKIAVIGGGPSGLVVAKYCLQNNFDCNVFEQRGYLGGTWNPDKIAHDRNDKLIYATTYEGLRTNIPKEIMTYPNYPFPSEETKSFLDPTDVFNYIRSYADKFNIHRCINYYTLVEYVSPNLDTTWNVTYKNLKTKLSNTDVYDFVFVCNGRFGLPAIPKIPGQDLFKGSQIHSKQYLTPDVYRNRKVVVVGARSSARDIVSFISSVAKQVIVSYRESCFVNFTSNTTPKPPIKEIHECSVIFEDGTKSDVDDIIYCTGYDYSFPFLSSECEVTVDNNFTYPLYQHIVNAHHPTMFFIGIPWLVCAFPLFDLQTRFSMAVIKNNSTLPSKEEMLKDIEEKLHKHKKLNIPKRHFHRIGKDQEVYWKDLARIASITPLPPVLCRIYEKARIERRLELHYRIIDDENFEIYTEK